jgi:hypothetical protein
LITGLTLGVWFRAGRTYVSQADRQCHRFLRRGYRLW